jgi:hypothetical protein
MSTRVIAKASRNAPTPATADHEISIRPTINHAGGCYKVCFFSVVGGTETPLPMDQPINVTQGGAAKVIRFTCRSSDFHAYHAVTGPDVGDANPAGTPSDPHEDDPNQRWVPLKKVDSGNDKHVRFRTNPLFTGPKNFHLIFPKDTRTHDPFHPVTVPSAQMIVRITINISA